MEGTLQVCVLSSVVCQSLQFWISYYLNFFSDMALDL